MDIAAKKHRIVEEWFPAMVASDEESMANLLADKADYWCPESTSGHLEPRTGRTLAAFIATAAPNLYMSRRWTWHQVIGEEPYVALRGTLEATTTAGNEYQNSYHWLFRFEDDRIAEIWECMDTIPYLRSQGRLD